MSARTPRIGPVKMIPLLVTALSIYAGISYD
jgi:hypothetical protein